MKTFLLTMPLALVIASSAFAADAVYETTPEPVATETYASWTGFYAGVQLGGAFGDSGTFAVTPFTGGLQTAFAPGFSGDFDSGVVGGAHIGYDQQYGSWVVGGIFDISATDIGDIQQGRSITPATYTIGRDLDYLATLRARLGYTVTDSMLAYATGGLAYGDVDFSYSQPGSGAVTTTSGGQDSKFGYTVGAGLEAKLTEQVSFGVEYLYTNLGGNDFRANLVGGAFGAGTTGFGTNDDFDFHTVQVKLSYRF
ncbi:outer membrane protein [Pararhizobium sp.]|uniref:outer membrane protein n=1 Tax=Pararhizobium sp. TaxID=1977563 RepID=UPI0027281BB5|nr:outer membrane protein [Pararhizobium sp.]MDO9415702.1 porin family protein [Pararhizobium sp.]